MSSTQKCCDDLSMISIMRRMLSDLHVVLLGTFSGLYTNADRRDFIIGFISVYTHAHATTSVPPHSRRILVVRIMPVEMYGKS